MAYRVFRGGTEITAQPVGEMGEAVSLVESEMPSGIFPGIWWTWALGALQARSPGNGMVAYSIRPVT